PEVVGRLHELVPADLSARVAHAQDRERIERRSKAGTAYGNEMVPARPAACCEADEESDREADHERQDESEDRPRERGRAAMMREAGRIDEYPARVAGAERAVWGKRASVHGPSLGLPGERRLRAT